MMVNDTYYKTIVITIKWYGASLGCPKTLKRNMLRVFRCPI